MFIKKFKSKKGVKIYSKELNDKLMFKIKNFQLWLNNKILIKFLSFIVKLNKKLINIKILKNLFKRLPKNFLKKKKKLKFYSFFILKNFLNFLKKKKKNNFKNKIKKKK